MNLSPWKLPLFILSINLFACAEDASFIVGNVEEETSRTFPNVDQDLWPFFEAFEQQAAARNTPVDLVRERIFGFIEPIDEANVVGSCSYGGFAPGKVVIDNLFWSRADYYSKEMIVFHELGHCFLFRDHLEGRRSNGSCISIMRSGLESCRDTYSYSTKDYYLNELFSINNRTN